ncbi:hypothetical protein T4E_9438 [Trichinella pseudospiralis]|uniref:Uncharacterized protein n=1 Tax=Trichinella pseudospiralis TaxID=6337 RepID=A0A0V0YD14_TRIPS|nr:hypothetical protein T4E_9438 [Trichinella pseudospiralis]
MTTTRTMMVDVKNEKVDNKIKNTLNQEVKSRATPSGGNCCGQNCKLSAEYKGADKRDRAVVNLPTPVT